VSSERKVVAVIEADATDRRSLCTLLSSLDVDVHDYDSAESYLASHDNVLGCLITDVTLPGMSGLDLLRFLRTSGGPPPTILLGDEADVSGAVRAMQEGAVDFIERPHADLAILRRVAHLIDHGQITIRH
jgi:two-component system response regulator FixJ